MGGVKKKDEVNMIMKKKELQRQFQHVCTVDHVRSSPEKEPV